MASPLSRPVLVLLPTVAALLCPGPALGHPPATGDPSDNSATAPHTDALPAADTPRVRIEVRGDTRVITANGLPDHETGRFPNRNNPNRIAAQSYRFEMPVSPTANDEPTDARGRPFGVALNGVVFDPGTAENWTPQGLRRGGPPTDWTYEALGGAVDLGVDDSHAHVQPTGAYHYHGIPTALLQHQTRQQTQPGPVLLGYAADGFPIYGPLGYTDPMHSDSELVTLRPSYRLKPGTRPGGDDGPGGGYDGAFVQDWEYEAGLGDLDECNGRFGVTPEHPDGTYHYVLTEAYPFVPRHFRGTPDESFDRRRGPRGPGPGERRGPRDGGRHGPPSR